MAKTKVGGMGRFYCYYPTLVALVTVRTKEKENVMAAAWHSPISVDPPLYGVAISPERFTYGLILETGKFGINFLPGKIQELIASVGGCSGKDVNKFERFRIEQEDSAKADVPILKDAYAAMECRLFARYPCGDHDWFVGEVVASYVDKDSFDADGLLMAERVLPPLYQGKDHYLTPLSYKVQVLDRNLYGRGKKRPKKA